jgi:sulfate adenylyltransferase subunit 1 (EFTu-like GTPase family)
VGDNLMKKSDKMPWWKGMDVVARKWLEDDWESKKKHCSQVVMAIKL